ncbi:MAG: hypothetical protein MJ232_06560 [archaeon]|nr:hypothetical protein [archaeon]
MKKQLNKINIEELKKQLIEKGLTHRERAIEISKALDNNFKVELEEIRASLDDKRVTINDIQPYIASRQPRHNGTWEMGLHKSKGLINRHCYK